MTKPDTPFPKHWLYYIVIKYIVIAAAARSPSTSHLSCCEFVMPRDVEDQHVDPSTLERPTKVLANLSWLFHQRHRHINQMQQLGRHRSQE